jgi:4-aminobutyrate aminotransferase-like enzyme
MNNIIARAKQLGVLFKTMGSALEFAPPLIVTKTDIDEALEVLDRSISEEQKDMGSRRLGHFF